MARALNLCRRFLAGRFAPCAALGVMLWVAGCARHADATGILRISQRNEPASLDPQLASLPDEFFILRALDEGLVRPVPEGEAGPPSGFLPAAADSWESSADGLTWTFHLARDARWSNGDPVTAGDFVATIRRALNPALAAPKAALFYPLRNAAAFNRGKLSDPAQVGATARDDHTLVLQLERPTPYLLALAASGPWLPVHAATLERFGDSRESAWTRPGNFVGNGPFVLTAWKPHELIAVRRNPHYRDAARVHVDGVDFCGFDNENTEERAFRAGQIDITMTVPVSRLTAYAPPVLRRQPLAETRFLAVNLARPPLNDVRVRRALSLAIDRSALVTAVLHGGQQPAAGFIPPGLQGYDAAATEDNGAGAPGSGHAADLVAARQLLAAAGFPEGRGFPRIELSTWTNNPVLEAVQQMWRRDLGVDIAVAVREARVHAAALRSGDFALGFLPAIPDFNDPAALLDELRTGAPGNYPRWSNPRFDDLVADADVTRDRAARRSTYRKAEEILLTDLPVIPLYFNTQNYLLAPRVQGWHGDRFWNRTYVGVALRP